MAYAVRNLALGEPNDIPGFPQPDIPAPPNEVPGQPGPDLPTYPDDTGIPGQDAPIEIPTQRNLSGAAIRYLM